MHFRILLTIFLIGFSIMAMAVLATYTHLLIAIIVFILPFLLGILLLSFQLKELFYRWQYELNAVGENDEMGIMEDYHILPTTSGNYVTINTQNSLLKINEIEVPINGISPDQIKILQGMSPTIRGSALPGIGSLAERLKEIQEALTAGLIAHEEYNRLREEIINKLV
jgi:hypothetical protein